MWCENTSWTIFPKRKLGHLKDGYEASLLALGGNPLEDFANVQRIEQRVKQGVPNLGSFLSRFASTTRTRGLKSGRIRVFLRLSS
jgi:hypothetical protein